jgi:hypothetical protein
LFGFRQHDQSGCWRRYYMLPGERLVGIFFCGNAGAGEG